MEDYCLIIYNFNFMHFFVCVYNLNFILYKKILVTDIIWLLATLILSILCAVQEANYNEYSSFFIYYINEGGK